MNEYQKEIDPALSPTPDKPPAEASDKPKPAPHPAQPAHQPNPVNPKPDDTHPRQDQERITPSRVEPVKPAAKEDPRHQAPPPRHGTQAHAPRHR